jgi:predicted PhzF superfamily epimerase YddE/YHI9
MAREPTQLMQHTAIPMAVFTGPNALGSPQVITFVSSEEAMIHALPDMQPGIDYSIAYYNDDDEQVQVVWHNHANRITFCGSAAYGLAYYLLHTLNKEYLTISSGSLHLNAKREGHVSVSLPSTKIHPVPLYLFEKCEIYHQRESGIYCVALHHKDQLLAPFWNAFTIRTLPLTNPHGLCLFYWSDAEQTGYVRYFTPWHGRPEDHVTGSIQSVLTPFIAKQYGALSQRWIQLSPRGGLLHTEWFDDRVHIHGQCELLPDLPLE